MRNRRMLTIVAGTLAVLAVVSFAVLAMLNHRAPEVPTRPVVVADRDIAAKEKLSEAMFSIQQKNVNEVDPSTLTSLSAVDGMVAAQPISAGSAVTSTQLTSLDSLGVAVTLHRGMRAIAIAVDPIKDVSDLLRPGDRVDVIASPPKAGDQVGAFTIMRNIQVLSVGSTFTETPAPAPNASAGPAPAPIEARTVTLEVSPSQANLLTMADLNTTLRLALRPPNEGGDSDHVEQLIFFSATPAPQMQAPASAQPKAAPAARPVDGVPVINGDSTGGGGGDSTK